jgi:hypothetical protein
MRDTLSVTILLIFIFSFIAAFIRGRRRDICLDNFSNDLVTLEKITGNLVCGILRVEKTGVELKYSAKATNENGQKKTSYILYKSEYPSIQTFIRYYEELDEQSKRKRMLELRRTYHPSFLRRLRRRVRNFLSTIRDSVIDVIDMVVGQARKKTPVSMIPSSQDKYISKIKEEIVNPLGNAFEPLLETHIGKRVVLELTKMNKVIEYFCVLKDYTVEFIEVMDVDYRISEDQPPRKADLVIPRQYVVIRHLGE